MPDLFYSARDNWEAGEIRNVPARKCCGCDEILRDVFYDDAHRDLRLPHAHVLPLIDDAFVGAENINAPILPIPIPNPCPPGVDQSELGNERIDTRCENAVVYILHCTFLSIRQTRK